MQNGYTLTDIGAALGAVVVGDGDIVICEAAEPKDAGPTSLALAMDPKYAQDVQQGQASAAALWMDADWQSFGLKGAILVPRARVAMAGLTAMLDPGPAIAPGIHPSAVIDPSATIGAGAAIGPFVAIGAGVCIGDNARIASHVSIADDTTLGNSVLLHAGVRIGRGVRMGHRVILHPGAVIGGDGFSFVTAEKSRAEAARETLGDSSAATDQAWIRIHSLGSVVIGDDVEIGCNSCVDAGTIRPTRIAERTKIDNQVHVAHNCEIGRDCLFAGQVGIAGSAKIGNNVILGGQVGIADNIFVGDGVVAGGASVVLSNVPAGRVLLGYPATKMDTQLSTYKALRRLPRLTAQVAELQKAVSKPDSND